MKPPPVVTERRIRRAEREHVDALRAVEREAHRATQAALELERLRKGMR